MKKMNILFILITLIMIFGTTNSYALSYDYTVGEQIRVLSVGDTKDVSLSIANVSLSNGYAEYNLKFDNDNGNYNSQQGAYGYQFNNAKFVRMAYSGALYSYTSNTTGINLSETCSQQTDGVSQYTVTYADGSHATINRSQWQSYCYNHDISGTFTSVNTMLNELQPRIILISNASWQQCEMDNGYILCPVKPNHTYYMLRIEYKTYQMADSVIKYDLRFHRALYTINTDTETIINNNNQNTNTINNSIQDTKDTITSNTIDSNTNTDNLITIPNSDGKNTILDLLMVPINFITSIVNSFSNSCVSYNLGNLLGTDLILPCINLQNILGSSLYNIIDAIFAFGMIFAFIRSVKKFIQKALLLASDVSSEVSIF